MTVLILSAAIFFLGAFVQGLTGFGSALVALPLLCLLMGIKMAVPLCLLNGLIITTWMAYKLREAMELSKIAPLLIGSFPGIIIGVLFLKQVQPEILKMLLGILLISYSLYNLVLKLSPIKLPKIFGYLAGFCSGAITASLSAGGPPVIIYTTLSDWSKDQIKATLAGFFMLNAYIAVGVQSYSGLLTHQVLEIFAVTAFFVLLGTVAGLKVAERINRQNYLKLVFIFLLIMGVMMIWGQ